MNSALSDGAAGLSGVSDQIEHAFELAGTQTDKMADGLRQAAGAVDANVSGLNELRDKLDSVDTKLRGADDSLPEDSYLHDVLQPLISSVGALKDSVRDAIDGQTELSAQLTKTADDLVAGKATAPSRRPRMPWAASRTSTRRTSAAASATWPTPWSPPRARPTTSPPASPPH